MATEVFRIFFRPSLVRNICPDLACLQGVKMSGPEYVGLYFHGPPAVWVFFLHVKAPWKQLVGGGQRCINEDMIDAVAIPGQ